MATKFQKHGSIYRLHKDEDLVVTEKLETGIYTVGVIPETGELFLQLDRSSYKEPKELFGDISARANRILNTFHSRPEATGVLLAGEKGCGKTLLAKLISARADMPTIIINSPLRGPGFNQFIAAIDQPAIIIFDEFEKVYREEKDDDGDSRETVQTELLTLLDGAYPTKKLFILTVNDPKQISKYMLNRPGRLFYSLEYSGLDENFIRDYCSKKLNNQEYTEQVVIYSNLVLAFNFDMLAAIVEEMNRYGESCWDVVELLNVRGTGGVSYSVEVTFNEEAVRLHTCAKRANPIKDSIQVELDYYADPKKDKTVEKHRGMLGAVSFIIAPFDFVKAQNKTFYYEKELPNRLKPGEVFKVKVSLSRLDEFKGDAKTFLDKHVNE